MTRSCRIAAAALVVAAAIPALATSADARPRRTSNEIVVTKRSYLDAGTAVKPGTSGALNYVYVGQAGLTTPDYDHIDSQFGAETLPRRWELPGLPGRGGTPLP